MTSLADKVIVVTGAARGLGRHYADACADAGADVILADIEAGLGREAARAITGRGGKATFLAIDLGDPDSIAQFGREIAGRWSRVDGLVNNAAIATGIGGKTFDEIDIATWDRVMTVNVRGTWLVVKALAPLLRKAKRGKIVNVSSDTALWGAPVLLHYVASKGAIISMTRSLARELGPDGIAVNCIAPGLTRVEATEYVPKHRHELYETGRAMPGAQMPEDCVGAVLYFLSPGADFVTGQLLPVNGGFVFN
ncbi:MAG: SDR family oxidoreductase [Alphaproteobacteria bacterium]|nr:SDR family oxidoreductase [Alphaproteobacteria bacterium]